MNILHMLIGLPRSGKSTKARELGFPIVEPDAIRKTLKCYPFDPSMEHLVWSTAQLMVSSLFNAGHRDVILDAVNHTKERRSLWESEEWAIKFHQIQTPEGVCISRLTESNQALLPIIERMSSNMEWIRDEDC